MACQEYFIIKGPVWYNLHLKISASKQNLPFQGAGYFPSADFLVSTLGKLKSFAEFLLIEK